jgi:flagellar FliG-like protein
MPARQLPDHPSLRHLRNEAKALRGSVRQGDAEATTLVRAHLRRLHDLTDEQIAAASVSLQEIQHALACDYGFSEWTTLTDAVEPHSADIDLSALARLPARDAEIALRAIDRRDLIRALVPVEEALTAHILANLSPRQATWARGERAHERLSATAELIDVSRQRVIDEVRQLAADGVIAWPPIAGAGAPAEPPVFDDHALSLIRTPVPDLTRDQIIAALRAFADFVADHGWNATEGIAAQAPEFLGEGIRLIIDGTEPPLVKDLLETRMPLLLQRHRTYMAVMVEALFSVICGDNPRIVAYKVETIYQESVALADAMDLAPELFETAQIEYLRAILGRGPFRELSLDEMRDFYVRLDILCRRDGIRAMAGLDGAADDELLPLALRLIGELSPECAPGRLSPDDWVARVEAEMRRVIEELHHRYQMAVEGLCAVQSGATAEDVEKAIREVERKAFDEVRGERW